LLIWRWALLGGYLLVIVGMGAWWFFRHPGLGMEIFPTVDAGQFQMRLRAPTGTHIDYTEKLTRKALDVIKEEVGEDNLDITICYVGVVPPSYPINNVYLWTSGPGEAVLRVALRQGSGIRIEKLKQRLRQTAPDALQAYLLELLVADKMSREKAAERVKGLRLSFEPADIVNEVMSFGAPTPVEVAVNGQKLEASETFAQRIRAELAGIPSLQDLQVMQPMDFPTIDVKVDREKLGRMGGTVRELTDSTIAGTSSSRYMVPMYWPDPQTGIGFQVQVEIPAERMKSELDIALLRVRSNDGAPPMRVRDVARVQKGKMPGEYDRYNMRRLVSLTANIEGEDLGHVADRIDKALAAAGEPPPKTTVELRGQIVPMRQMFRDLALGLALAVAVIFALLTAYFQSVRLAVIVVLTAPAVIAGVFLALVITRTTLNIQSFMGAIMAIGVAVANSILLVTFAERQRLTGKAAAEAAVAGAQGRLRPILMTSFAMIAGMVPMALAFGEGGEQTAPLARAVIGGLAAATLTTLFIVPALFTVIQAGAGTQSVSLDPEDPQSVYFARYEPHATPNGEGATPLRHVTSETTS
jgi:multidrug efflux pump subunit AcrB